VGIQNFNSSLAILSAKENDPVMMHVPLTYNDISFLQNALFKPDIYHILFQDFTTCQLTLNACIQYCNKTVGYLSRLHTASDSQFIFIDLHTVLQDYYRFGTLHEFFLDYTHIDLLLIDRDPSFFASSWFSEFEKNIVDFNIQNTIPIFIISYKDGSPLSTKKLRPINV